MNLLFKLSCIAIFSAMLVIVGCIEEPASQQAELPKFDGKIGQTPRSEYLQNILSDLVVYVDASGKIIYGTEGGLSSLKTRLNVEELDNQAWNVKGLDDTATLYQVRSMKSLDLSAPVNEGDQGIAKDWWCVSFKEGICINVVGYPDQGFSYSVRIPKPGVIWCRPKKDSLCYFQWTPFTIEKFDKRDCKGNKRTIKDQLMNCNPT